LVFFFQAEDGIRDWSVTGVQTCALPILQAGRGAGRAGGVERGTRRPRVGGEPGPGGRRRVVRACRCRVLRSDWRRDRSPKRPYRSEERRVGKEGRARGWGEQ